MLFRPSGGLLYHWRAFRSRADWREFTSDLEVSLNKWKQSGGTLVLVGPSGGYTLPNTWLRGFEVIHAYDIDPLAHFFFNLCHRGVHADFHTHDVFWREGKLATAGVESLVRNHPGATFLFCNVLGQLPLENELSEHDFARYLQHMRASLRGVRWASYHDVYSAENLNARTQAELACAFRANGNVDISLPSAPVELVDHMIQGEWSRDLERAHLAWPLSPSRLHLIELVHS